jgi:hypothetical protein
MIVHHHHRAKAQPPVPRCSDGSGSKRGQRLLRQEREGQLAAAREGKPGGAAGDKQEQGVCQCNARASDSRGGVRGVTAGRGGRGGQAGVAGGGSTCRPERERR